MRHGRYEKASGKVEIRGVVFINLKVHGIRALRDLSSVRQLTLLSVAAVFGLALWSAEQPRIAGFAQAAAHSGQAIAAEAPEMGVRFASSRFDQHVHAASISPLPDGGLMAVWFAGSREGARDVDIHGARFDPRSRRWGREFELVSRAATEEILQRDIRKLGNPVIALAPDNRLWLFYVSVSMGGWAGSAINAMYSDDGGRNWSPPKRLITSPFFNVSTLVRNPPVFHADGSIGLPVYHEFLGKFAEYLYLDRNGEVIDKFRISAGEHSLQPSVVPTGGDSAVAFLRNAGMGHGKVMVSFTGDRGRSWSPMIASEPWNPNSALSAVGEGNGHILVALNDIPKGRFRLSLYHTDEQLSHWRRVRVLDQSPVLAEHSSREAFVNDVVQDFLSVEAREGGLKQLLQHLQERACEGGTICESKYEYPTMIRTPDGYFHVVYSWNNTLIKHVFFNRAWLEEQS